MIVGLTVAVALMGCRLAGESERQVYHLAHEVAGEIYDSGTAAGSREGAIVREATGLAARQAGSPDRPIEREQFPVALERATEEADAGFWGTPLGQAARLALMGLGVGGLGQGLRLLRRRKALFETVVEAVDLFATKHPRAGRTLKRVVQDTGSSVKGFDQAITRAKGG